MNYEGKEMKLILERFKCMKIEPYIYKVISEPKVEHQNIAENINFDGVVLAQSIEGASQLIRSIIDLLSDRFDKLDFEIISIKKRLF